MEGCGGDDLGGRHSSHALQGLVLSCLILGEDSGGEGLSSGEARQGGLWSGKLSHSPWPEPWTGQAPGNRLMSLPSYYFALRL